MADGAACTIKKTYFETLALTKAVKLKNSRYHEPNKFNPGKRFYHVGFAALFGGYNDSQEDAIVFDCCIAH